MNSFLIFVFGVVVGGIVARLLAKPSGPGVAEQQEKKKSLIEKQAREKEENKRRILGLLETQTPLANNHIEQLLVVSDATATRYLEELEKEGLIRQVGQTGRHVYYEKVQRLNDDLPLSR